MADNSLRTPGSGESIATDEITYSGDTTKVQLVRLVHVSGSEGAKTLTEYIRAEDSAHTSGDLGITTFGVRNDADAALSGTDGDYTPPSTTSSGKVHIVNTRDLVRVQVASASLTTATTTYAAGDTLGSLMSFTGMARKNGGTGRILSLVMTDYSDVIGAVDAFFFRNSVTFGTDNSAPSISDADTLELVGMASMIAIADLANNKVLVAHNLNIPYDTGSGTTLYVGLVTRTANAVFAGGADSLKLTIFAERD